MYHTCDLPPTSTAISPFSVSESRCFWAMPFLMPCLPRASAMFCALNGRFCALMYSNTKFDMVRAAAPSGTE